MLTACVAIVLDVAGPGDIGIFYLYPGLLAVFASNGFNPHVDLAALDHAVIILITALVWSSLITVFWAAVRKPGRQRNAPASPN